LVLEISTGQGNALDDLRHALPEVGLFAWSFFLTARFWQLHLRLFSALNGKINERLVELNNQLLFFIVLLPFATAFFGNHFHNMIGLAVYAVDIILIGYIQITLRRRILSFLHESGDFDDGAVGDSTPYILTPTIMAISLPLAFLNPRVAYGFWALVVALTILRVGGQKLKRALLSE